MTERATDMTTLDILTKAKDLIEENGFVQGVFVNQDNNTGTLKYCAIGAIGFACNHRHTEKVTYIMRCATKSSSLTLWNDEPGRTKEEVLEAFDKAIEITKRLGTK